jgi:hypothetical protein
MRRVTRFSSVAVFAFSGLIAASAAWAAPLDPVALGFTADADSWYPYNDPGVRSPIHAFDGSGLNAGGDTIFGTTDDTHTGVGAANPNSDTSWMTQTNNGANPQPWTGGQRWLMVDMQANRTIGAIQIWNYFEGDGSRGVKSTDIWYQTSTGTGAIPVGSGGDSVGGTFVSTGWTNLGAFTLNEALANPTGITDTIDPTDFVARYVLLDIHTNYGSNPNTNETGMGEVRFLEGAEAPSGVPEPSTFVLGAMGLVGLGCVALRKKFRRTGRSTTE